MPTWKYRVFVSHSSLDRWVAEQIVRRITTDCGCATFLDAFDVKKGDDIEARVFGELARCHELVILFTPWSVGRKWLWIELGAARQRKMRIVPVLYGLTLKAIDDDGGLGFLGAKNVLEINDLEAYFLELSKRVKR